MKTCTVFAATAALAMLSLDSASAMRSYLKKFPNGDAAFTQALGHVGETEVLNDFGKLFSGESNTYSEKLCKSTFPGTSMTVGEAFGDPCCTWKAGGKADFTVTPFTVPTDKKTCAASAPAGGDKPAAPATPAAGGDKPAAPAAGGDKPAAPAPAGAATPAPAGKPDTPVVTPAAGKPDAGKPGAGKPDAPAAPPAPPAGKPDAGKPPAGKPDAGKPSAGKPGKPSKCGVKKEAKSLDEDENDENDENDNDDVFDY